MTNAPVNLVKRRDLITTAAVAALVSKLNIKSASAAQDVRTMDVRGRLGQYVRLPDLYMEGKGNFLASMDLWRRSRLTEAAGKRALEIFEQNGIASGSDISWENTVALVADDPTIAMMGRARHSHQILKYSLLQREFYNRADEFLSEMERVDKLGPGSLELNPSMFIPEYTRHEIHCMPGGYVGDAFAGHMYHASTNLASYADVNYQDGFHMAMARFAATPEDGKVQRILDLGTSIGQFATSMKRRFPDAEVWGIDVGAPMVRYAHLKAVDMGVDVNFAQRLAEDTGFPDNHFDIVTSHLLFHEVNYQATKDIINEAYRVLRPGGVFSPTDTNIGGTTPLGKFWWWYGYRWNHEDWMADWAKIDFAAELRNAGFKVIDPGREREPQGYPESWRQSRAKPDRDKSVRMHAAKGCTNVLFGWLLLPLLAFSRL